MNESIFAETVDENSFSSQSTENIEPASVADYLAIKLKCGISVIRKKLKPFLEESFPGLEILWHCKAFNSVTELMNNLCDMLIDREVTSLIRSSQASPDNPLPRVT